MGDSGASGRESATRSQPVRKASGAGSQPAAKASGTGSQPVTEYLVIKRRDLPHWQAGGSTYFITFRLKGYRGKGPQPVSARANTRARPPRRTSGTGSQPVSRLTAEERGIVRAETLFWHGKRWTVHMLTVMPDHAHILATPLERARGEWFSLSEILHSVKYGSALKINRLRGRRGALWLSESFDRIVRNEGEFDQKATYILSNASVAGLVLDGWKWDGLWCEGVEKMR